MIVALYFLGAILIVCFVLLMVIVAADTAAHFIYKNGSPAEE